MSLRERIKRLNILEPERAIVCEIVIERPDHSTRSYRIKIGSGTDEVYICDYNDMQVKLKAVNDEEYVVILGTNSSVTYIFRSDGSGFQVGPGVLQAKIRWKLIKLPPEEIKDIHKAGSARRA